jgi:hypothetical protein
MKLVIIESPYAGDTQDDIDRNVDYAHAALRDSLFRGEAPFGSHIIYTIVLDDKDPVQRKLGIEAGYAWMRQASLIAFYIDNGMSPGMLKAKEKALLYRIPTEERKLYKERKVRPLLAAYKGG